MSTAITAAFDITDNKKLGKIVLIDNINAFADMMAESVKNQDELETSCIASQEFAYENFYWPQIGEKIHNVL